MTKADYLYYIELRAQLREAVKTMAANPAASVTISTGDGTKSVTYKSLDSVNKALGEVEAKISAFERAYAGNCGFSVSNIHFH